MKNPLFFLVLAAGCLFSAFPTRSHADYWSDSPTQKKADAPQTTVAAPDNRTEKRFGIEVGLLSDPFLSFASINLAYNVNEFLRVNGGFGTAGASASTSSSSSSFSTSSFGLGIKALVPHWEFSPVFGLNLSEMSLNSGFTGLFTVSGGTSINLLFFYPDIGLDYQAKDGFELGFGFNIPMLINSNVSNQIPILFIPELNIGKFF